VQQKQLRDLNQDHSGIVETLTRAQKDVDRAQASVNLALKLIDGSYHRKRKAILANGHDQEF
jgi:hypothetical protein